MLGILLRRVRDLAIVLLVVGTTLFFVVRLIPGDPAEAMLGDFATDEQLEELRRDLGLSGPLHEQYLAWIGRVLQGDLGRSITRDAPVIEVLLGSITPTLTLAVLTIAISFLLAIGISVWSMAAPRNRVATGIAKITTVGLAVPGFWIALILIWIFAVQLRLVPTSGYVPITENPGAALVRLILPVTALVIASTAQFTLVLRESMLREVTRLYVRTARAKGIGEFGVMLRHVLPNAMLPVITVVGLDFALLLGGVVVTESIFVIPGLGSVMLSAIASRDYLLVQGGALLVAFFFVLVNLVVDLLYLLLNPRVRVS